MRVRHKQSGLAKTARQRFDDNIAYAGDCIVWTGVTSRGYGRLQLNNGKRVVSQAAHRFAWEQQNGPVAEGFELDHLCRNTICVNPAHLEPVTHLENVRRGALFVTHCSKGHAYDSKNTCVVKTATGTQRRCRACRRESMRKRRSHHKPAFIVEKRKES